jgi:hypothetical protein
MIIIDLLRGMLSTLEVYGHVSLLWRNWKAAPCGWSPEVPNPRSKLECRTVHSPVD